jgi:biopolymer transport protein ExbB
MVSDLSPVLTPVTGLLDAGGVVMWIIAGLSVVALTLIIGKIIEFWRAGLWRRQAAEAAVLAWQRGDANGALARLAHQSGPVAEVVAIAVRGRLQAAQTDDVVREEVARAGAAQLERLRIGLRPLEVIGTLAPLLGLLGTVIGMIDAFRELEAAGSRVDPAVLSGGIWVALLTTAGGLSVAIPTVAAHVWLERQVERLHHAMQDAATRIFTHGEGVTRDQAVDEAAGTVTGPCTPAPRLAEGGRAD